jgi:hypothetical protein
MLQRRRTQTSIPLRSSLANAAFAVEERVVWGGADVLRGVLDVVKWPFERAVWAIERGLVWPLEERTGDWSGPLRGAGIAAVALLAAGAGVLGLVWASGSGGGSAQRAREASAPIVAPVTVAPAAKESLAQAAPVLQGSPPDFTPKAGATQSSETGTGSSEPATTGSAATTDKIASAPGASASAEVVPVGPAATKVARRFAAGFVLYETGRADATVRTAFAATATPELARELLRRPPRLPANVKVPKAKVLNVVPGPVHGDTHTLSVSLLRLGVTSELRIDMQRDPKSGEWQVTDALG